MVDAPASTLGAYFSGRHTPTSSATPVVRALVLALGVDDADVDEWLGALRRARGSEARKAAPAVGGPPYRGLASFGSDDAGLFFGRGGPTREILDRLVELAGDPGPSNGVLAVVAPSGAGKSSVLRAGVEAAIRAGDLDAEDAVWTCEVGTPNAPAPEPPDGSATSSGTRRVLVIDQFEEVFTSLDPERADALLGAVADHARDEIVVLGMRADFYADAARVPAVLAALQNAQVVIGPMSPDELRDAIRLPAERCGLEVEDGLVELVLADLGPRAGRGAGAHDVGTLPLMSHALLAAWDRSDGRRLTIADYRATGGLDGAVQQTAEDAYAGLPPEQRRIARSVFLRLVNVDDDVLTTRRRLDADELNALGWRDDARQLVSRFVEHRLLTAGDGWYEISHEALLSAWPRLRAWVDEDRAGLVTHRRLTDAAAAWVRSGRDAGALLRGSVLDVVVSWADSRPSELNEAERDLVAASVAARANELRSERRRLQRLRGLLAASVVLVVVAVVLSLVLVQERDRADHSRQQEHVLRNVALSRAAAFEATELQADDPAVAQQLAIAAFHVTPTDEARAALIDESAKPLITRILGQQGPTALAVSRDGTLIAVSHAIDGSVHLYTRRAGAVPTSAGTIPGTRGQQVFALAFDPDHSLLAVGGSAQTVRLVDVANPSRPTVLDTLHPKVSGAIEALAISPDGRTLVAGSTGVGEITRWDIGDPRVPRTLPQLAGVPSDAVAQSVAFDADGGELAVGTSSGTTDLWSTSAAGMSHRPRKLTMGETTVDAVAFDPVRPVLFTADRLGDVDVWSTHDVQRGPLRVLHGRTNSQINALAVSPQGTAVAAGSSDGDLRQWSTSGWAVTSDVGNPGPVVGVAYTRDGDVVSTAADGALRLEPADSRSLPTSGSTFALVWSANGRRLLVGTNGTAGSEQLWDASDPGHTRRLGPALRMPSPYEPIAGSGALDASGDLVAGGNAQGRVALWNTTDPSHPEIEGTPFLGDGSLVESLAFTPDQHLLAVAGDDDRTHLWDVRDPAHPRELASMKLDGAILSVAISNDGRLLAVADTDHRGYLYRISDPRHPVLLAHVGGFRSYAYGVAFSPNGRTLAVSDADTTTRLFDIARPTRPTLLGHALVGPSDYDYVASFTPNGHTVAVASNDGTVRLYRADGSDALPLETLRAAGSNLFVAAYNPAGTVLAGGGRSDDVTLWSTDVHAIARRVCRVSGAPVTSREWRLYLPGQPYRPPCT
ncbi:MAG: hypothetical protein INR67_09720 [Jatrophihabitans endophyticus]|nr:hypothetical protein [Jatrophihabitans endophyticus]